jgi:hypothetical protein
VTLGTQGTRGERDAWGAGDARGAERLLEAALRVQPESLEYQASYAVVLADETFRQYNRSEAIFVKVRVWGLVVGWLVRALLLRACVRPSDCMHGLHARLR